MNIHSSGAALRRRDEIKKLVAAGGVRSQEELGTLLSARGYAVTQPTLSRDLKELGLAKTARGYVLTEPPSARALVAAARPAAPDVRDALQARLDRILSENVLAIEPAGSLVVVRTAAAEASPVAEAIDVARDAGLLDAVGTLAGENTVFVATRSSAAASRLVRRLSAVIAPPAPPALLSSRPRGARAGRRPRA